MEPVICPRCRARVEATAARCPACGVRVGVGIVAAGRRRPKSNAIAEGLPNIATQPHARPQSVSDRLNAEAGRRPYVDDDAGRLDDEAECRRIGWWLMAIRLLPFIVGAIFLLLCPAGVFATFTGMDLETIGLRNLLIFTALVAVPLALVTGLVWLVVRRNSQDDEDASC